MTLCRPLLPMLFLAVELVAAGRPLPATPARGDKPKGNCLVCGMFVANFPDWAAVLMFKDGSEAWFDGPKDLFTCLLDLRQHAPGRKPSDIASIQVKDYYGLKPLDARKAYYVVGSKVLGPMGQELVPLATETDAREFLKDHQGKRILGFQDITAATLKGLE